MTPKYYTNSVYLWRPVHAAGGREGILQVKRPLSCARLSLRCFPDDKPHVQSGTACDIHQRVQAEQADLALQERIEPRLRQSQCRGGLGLRHAALPVVVLDAHHELRSKLEVLGLGLRKSQIGEYIAATARALEFPAHCFLSLTRWPNLFRANAISMTAVFRAF